MVAFVEAGGQDLAEADRPDAILDFVQPDIVAIEAPYVLPVVSLRGGLGLVRELPQPVAELPVLDDRHVMAHARLLVRWVRIHLGEGRLPALEGWQAGLVG